MKQGLQAYLEENGFTREAYDAPRTEGSFLGFRFAVPNPPRHRWAIMRHDLHHVATGFGTDPAGEGQLAAWECRRGIRPVGVYVGSIVVSAFLLGLIVAPLRTSRAWRASGGGRSLFHDDAPDYDELLGRSIGELRAMLQLPRIGLCTGERGLHSTAPRARTDSSLER